MVDIIGSLATAFIYFFILYIRHKSLRLKVFKNRKHVTFLFMIAFLAIYGASQLGRAAGIF